MSSPSRSEEAAAQPRPSILIVEDNRADVFLIRESIEIAQLEADVRIFPDGDKAIRFFEEADGDGSGPPPSLVILDINLPRKSGREVLRQLRQSARNAHTPVLVVTSSGSERDREEMRRLGANGYFRKPSDYTDFMKLGALVRKMIEEAGGGETTTA